MAYDGNAKEIIRKTENKKVILLKGDEKDPSWKKLLEVIVAIIASETPADAIRMEVEVISQIIECKRNVGETPAEYANRFNSAVASYVNLTYKLNYSTIRQFSVMMLRNANMSPNTINALTY